MKNPLFNLPELHHFSEPEKRKVLVASHERSGTHFLMNAIADNFSYNSTDFIDIDWHTVVNPSAWQNFASFFSMFERFALKNTFKTHFPRSFFLKMGRVTRDFVVFYIYRNNVDTMESFSKHLNALPWFEGPTSVDGVSLSTMEPCGGLTRYQLRQEPTMYDRWASHVSDWLRAAEDFPITVVRFENLVEDFDNTMFKVGEPLGFTVRRIAYARPDKNDRVILFKEGNNAQSTG